MNHKKEHGMKATFTFKLEIHFTMDGFKEKLSDDELKNYFQEDVMRELLVGTDDAYVKVEEVNAVYE